jgi:hypothetical protein
MSTHFLHSPGKAKSITYHGFQSQQLVCATCEYFYRLNAITFEPIVPNFQFGTAQASQLPNGGLRIDPAAILIAAQQHLYNTYYVQTHYAHTHYTHMHYMHMHYTHMHYAHMHYMHMCYVHTHMCKYNMHTHILCTYITRTQIHCICTPLNLHMCTLSGALFTCTCSPV